MDCKWTPQPIGIVRSCFLFKNGTPRQPAIATNARGELKISKQAYNNPEHSLHGLKQFSHIWVIFLFHKNRAGTFRKAKVSPPRLNGLRMGVFATRSPYRLNPIGLSLVKLDDVKGDTLHFSGHDLVDGTPVLDVKPYIGQYDRPALAAEARLSCPADDSPTPPDGTRVQSSANLELSAPETVAGEREHCGLSAPETAAGEREHCGQSAPETVAGEREHCGLSAPETAAGERGHCGRVEPGSAAEKREHCGLAVPEAAAGEREHCGLSASETAAGEREHCGLSASENAAGERDHCGLSAPETAAGEREHSGRVEPGSAAGEREYGGPVDPGSVSGALEVGRKVACWAGDGAVSVAECCCEGGPRLACWERDTAAAGEGDADWVSRVPEARWRLRLTAGAGRQLALFSGDSRCPAHRLRWLRDSGELLSALRQQLTADPRSVYRRTRADHLLYHLNVDHCHATCWFDTAHREIELLRLLPLSHSHLADKLATQSCSAGAGRQAAQTDNLPGE